MAVVTRTNDQGFLEGVDQETGEVVWVEKRKHVLKDGKVVKASSPGRGRPRKVDLETHHYVVDGTGQKLWVPKGTQVDNLPRVAWPFSQVVADEVCRLVTEGATLKKIGQTEGMPPAHVIHKWARKYPEFRRELELAKRDRAEFYADRAMEFVETTESDTIHEDRLKTELLKWGAEVGNPDAYGKKRQAVESGGPVAFVIVTGVPQRAELEVASTAVSDLQLEQQPDQEEPTDAHS